MCNKIWKGRESVVGTATRYALDGFGFETLWGRDYYLFSKLIYTVRGTQTSCMMGTGVISRDKEAWVLR
jgi:hypothetical protein